MLNIRTSLLLSFILLPAISCKYKSPKPDISNIKLEIKIDRFEQDLFSHSQDTSLTSAFAKKYGNFWTVYVGNIMRLGNPADPTISVALSQFLADPSINELYQDCFKKYPKLTQQEKELTTAFKYFHHYFPNKNIPRIVSFVSGFSLGMAALDSIMGIGLDMYLGSDYEKYPFPEYQKKRMQPENIIPDCMYSWVSTEFEFDSDKDDLLSNMIYEGKMMYVMDLVLPDMQDSLKIAYTKNQMEWCKKNETNTWKYFIDNNLLYSTNKNEFYKKYFSEAPFTSGFPQDSPCKIAVWLGWQIVRSYMKNNAEIGIIQLLEQNDAQFILKNSKYKP